MRNAARTDKNQSEIVSAMRRCGISVEYIKLPLDLIVYNPRDGQTSLMEIKTEDGRLTKDQVEFIQRWPGKVSIVRTVEEALRAVLGDEAFGGPARA